MQQQDEPAQSARALSRRRRVALQSADADRLAFCDISTDQRLPCDEYWSAISGTEEPIEADRAVRFVRNRDTANQSVQCQDATELYRWLRSNPNGRVPTLQCTPSPAQRRAIIRRAEWLLPSSEHLPEPQGFQYYEPTRAQLYAAAGEPDPDTAPVRPAAFSFGGRSAVLGGAAPFVFGGAPAPAQEPTAARYDATYTETPDAPFDPVLHWLHRWMADEMTRRSSTFSMKRHWGQPYAEIRWKSDSRYRLVLFYSQTAPWRLEVHAENGPSAVNVIPLVERARNLSVAFARDFHIAPDL